MDKKLFKNFLYQASYQVFSIILPIITIPIVSNSLGPKGIGEYNFISSIGAYFVLLAGLGMANYGVREISIVRADKNKLTEKFGSWSGLIYFFLLLLLEYIFVFHF